MTKLLFRLILIICFIHLIFFTLSCQQNGKDAYHRTLNAMADLETQNKSLIQRWSQAINENDVDLLDEIIAPDFKMHSPSYSVPIKREDYMEYIRMTSLIFPDLHISIEDIAAENDKVAVRGVYRGTHSEEFMGIPETNRKVTFGVLYILRMVEGKIAEAWEESDELGLMEQLGMELQMIDQDEDKKR